MQSAFVEVTFRHGRPFAACVHLADTGSSRAVVRSEPRAAGLVVDFASGDRPVGIEITAPSRVRLDDVNALLGELGLETMDAADFAPLHAA